MKEIEINKFSILYTSNYVIDEFLNLTIKLIDVKKAIEWGKIIFIENLVHMRLKWIL
ncbi:MAG: hypothetical protein OEY49_13145 [Candidatus Heimdallarchaeota archaeon]|nr:hypothetical protein [Candidatus Heimdallarchaeota archaeon]